MEDSKLKSTCTYSHSSSFCLEVGTSNSLSVPVDANSYYYGYGYSTFPAQKKLDIKVLKNLVNSIAMEEDINLIKSYAKQILEMLNE